MRLQWPNCELEHVFGEKDTMKTNYSSSLPGTPTIEEIVMLKHIRGIASEHLSDAESDRLQVCRVADGIVKLWH